MKALYQAPVPCVEINDCRTNCYPTVFGVKEGAALSRTLFALCINVLIAEIKRAGIGVRLSDFTVGTFVFADNVVLLPETEQDLRCMLINIVHGWCSNCQLKINKDRTHIMHFRKKGRHKSKFVFHIGSVLLS